MAWLLCDVIGDGSEADPFRPAVADYGPGWSMTVHLEQRGRCIAKAPWQEAFGTDARIRKLTKALVSQYIPDDGEEDGEESAPLALKVVRRALLESWLGVDDFGDFDGLTVGDIPTAKRHRLIGKLDARGLDRSGITLSTLILDALRQLLPQIKARVLARQAAPSGTFTDDFSGEGSAVDLANHTPSGGTSWTRVDGSADMALVGSAGYLVNNTTNSSGAAYRCDDQGSADHYLQFVNKVTATVCPFACNRLTDRSNYIGVRVRGNGNVELYKRDAGSFTSLGSDSSSVGDGDSVRLESDGDAHEVYANTGAGYASIIGPVNDSFNNTETRQGVNARSEGTIAWLDDFEAGTLGGGATTFNESFALAADLGLTPAAQGVFGSSLTLAGELGVSAAAQHDMLAAVSLGISAAVTGAGARTMPAALSLAAQAGFTADSAVTLEAAASLALTLSQAAAGEVETPGVFNETMALGISALVEQSSTLGANAALTLAAELQQAAAGALEIAAAMTLDAEAGVTAAGGRVISGALSFPAGFESAFVSQAVLESGLTFTAEFDQAASAQLTLDESLALAVETLLSASTVSGISVIDTVELTGTLQRTVGLTGTLRLTISLAGRLN